MTQFIEPRNMTEELRLYVFDILKVIEKYKARHSRYPNTKDIYPEVMKRNGRTDASVYSAVIRMRKELGMLEDIGEYAQSLAISLRGYRFMEQMQRMQETHPNIKPEPKKRKPRKVTRKRKRVSQKKMDNKDQLIEFIKWVYELDDEEICSDGWKSKIITKVQSLFTK